jgi:hypothetical protein
MTSSGFLIDNFLGGITGIISGYASKKILIGKSESRWKKLMGIILQFGVTNVVAQNPEAIKTFGRFLVHRIFFNREEKSNKC